MPTAVFRLNGFYGLARAVQILRGSNNKDITVGVLAFFSKGTCVGALCERACV